MLNPHAQALLDDLKNIPHDVEAMLARVETWLHRHHTARAPAAPVSPAAGNMAIGTGIKDAPAPSKTPPVTLEKVEARVPVVILDEILREPDAPTSPHPENALDPEHAIAGAGQAVGSSGIVEGEGFGHETGDTVQDALRELESTSGKACGCQWNPATGHAEGCDPTVFDLKADCTLDDVRALQEIMKEIAANNAAVIRAYLPVDGTEPTYVQTVAKEYGDRLGIR